MGSVFYVCVLTLRLVVLPGYPGVPVNGGMHPMYAEYQYGYIPASFPTTPAPFATPAAFAAPVYFMSSPPPAVAGAGVADIDSHELQEVGGDVTVVGDVTIADDDGTSLE